LWHLSIASRTGIDARFGSIPRLLVLTRTSREMTSFVGDTKLGVEAPIQNKR